MFGEEYCTEIFKTIDIIFIIRNGKVQKGIVCPHSVTDILPNPILSHEGYSTT